MEKILLLAIIGIMLQAFFIIVEHKKKYLAALLLKTSASIIFVIISLITSKYCQNPLVSKYIVLGLCFGALGDFFLNLRFVLDKIGSKIFLIGILIFFTGHLMYLVPLYNLSSNTLLSIIIGIIASALLLIWIFKQIEAKMAFKIFGIFYIGAVTLMTCFALINFINNISLFTFLYALGALLFLISDIVLILNTFTKKTRFSMRITNLSLYYIGQLLIAISLFVCR